MNKLRNVLAAALLTIPLSLSAGPGMDLSAGQGLRPIRPLAGCCTVYFMGYYWCLPC
jgi:hypothetical protein